METIDPLLEIYQNHFYQEPLTIAFVALIWGLILFLLREKRERPRPYIDIILMITAGSWGLNAVWEWLVDPKTYMRVDLAIIVPFLFGITCVAFLCLVWHLLSSPELFKSSS